MKKEKYGFVYIWYDRKHKRYYVGCHWGTENDGYVCSSVWMKSAYNRRPLDFKRRILKTHIGSRLETYNEELRYLHMIKPSEIKQKYYNIKIDNNYIWHKYEDRIKTIGQKISASPLRSQRISEANTGRKHSEETKEKIRKIRTGTKLSEETKAKISSNHGRIYTPEFITDLKNRNKTRIYSEEERVGRSERNRRLQAEGKIGMRGKTHSEETKRKMSDAANRRNLNKNIGA